MPLSKNTCPTIDKAGSIPMIKLKPMKPTVIIEKAMGKPREINKIIGRIHEDGLTIVPTKMYFKKGKAKLEIAVAKGKKQFDKRLTKKTRDWNREKARYIRKSS